MSENIKILLTDDSSFMRGVLKNILSEAGYTQFEEAGDGEVALEKVKSFAPEIITLDLIMPKKGGIDVLKEIGKTQNVIVVTAIGQEEVVEEAKSLGAKGYIVKPFDKEQVLSEVKKVLGD